jgi:hypothetical protein
LRIALRVLSLRGRPMGRLDALGARTVFGIGTLTQFIMRFVQ